MSSDNTPKHRIRTRKLDASGTDATPRLAPTRRATVIKQDYSGDERIMAMKSFEGRQILDPFQSIYDVAMAEASVSIIRPPFNYSVLMKLPQENHTLAQCIAAMVTNIEGFGYRLEFIGENEELMKSKEAEAERIRLTGFMDRPNSEYGMVELRKRCRMDLETVGDAYIEITRDSKNRIAEARHVPVHHMRKTTREATFVNVVVKFLRAGEIVETVTRKRFRRYVQQVGQQTVYFKEFGDPRVIDYQTGKETADISRAASEIIPLSLYVSGHSYGAPRWINQMPAVLGSRECELTNLAFFKDNAIPAMAVIVSGGALTSDSMNNLNTAFSGGRSGLESMNKIVVLEATGDEDAADDSGKIPAPKVELKPLAGERQNDATFIEYDKENHEKIRSAFRIAPLFVGRATDYTRATAEASLVATESQVFTPERSVVDELINTCLLQDELGNPPIYWNVRSNPAAMASPESKLEALITLDKLGAMTPNIAIGIANELFNLDIAEVEEAWGNLPFQMTLLQAGKNPAAQTASEALDGLANPELKKITDANPEAAKAIKSAVDALTILTAVRHA